MKHQSDIATRADYGIDAPEVVRRFVIIGAVGIIAGILLTLLHNAGKIGAADGFASPLISIGGTFLLTACVMLWGSKIGKLRLRDRAINRIKWHGDEKVLDVGCGHGLMLIAAAKNLTSGTAVGVDIWQQEDQAGNSAEATLRNARLEAVADRVELKDGDARSLPFADETFDVVVSSWALHNIYDEAGRAEAVREITRVLKPGGQVIIMDIKHTAEYAQVLRACGMTEIERAGPNFLFFIPTYTLTASKILVQVK